MNGFIASVAVRRERLARLIGAGVPLDEPWLAVRAIHIFVPVYMMCAFGVPGNMIHGDVGLGRAEMPVV